MDVVIYVFLISYGASPSLTSTESYLIQDNDPKLLQFSIEIVYQEKLWSGEEKVMFL